YAVKVGVPEFLNGIGRGVETHVPKLESEIGDMHKLLVTRTLKLKKLGIPCKHRKLILNYAHKYRVGIWRPRAELMKA
ncbi:SAM_1 domain-containing protein/IGR domain-containing protein, partial [Cephalotus follicularis]